MKLTLAKKKYGASRVAKKVDIVSASEREEFCVPVLEWDSDSECSPKSGKSESQKLPKLLIVKANSADEKKSLVQLLDNMKSIVGSNKNCSRKPSTQKANYIFVNEKVRTEESQENAINDFLNNEGIFRIHLSAAMQEY